MNDLFDIFDLRFNRAFDEFFTNPKKITYPTNVIEYNNRIELEIAAVGKDLNDIAINIEEYVLRIKTKDFDKAGDIDDTAVEKGNYLVNRIKESEFNLAYQIGSQFDIDKIEAKMHHGLLTVIIPKKIKDIKKIEIKKY
jgi:HSP20 family protein